MMMKVYGGGWWTEGWAIIMGEAIVALWCRVWGFGLIFESIWAQCTIKRDVLMLPGLLKENCEEPEPEPGCLRLPLAKKEWCVC